MSKIGNTAIVFFFVVASGLLGTAQTAKVEVIGSLSYASVPVAVRKALQPQGYRITLDDGSVAAEIWLRRGVAAQEKKEVPGAIYSQLAESTLVGVISFPTAATDYRGQSIKPGTYTLRYALLPNDGNHLGVAPNRDFLLLIPAASDPDPDATYKFQQLVRLSCQATGTAHPGPMSLVQPQNGTEAGISKDEDEHWIFSTKLTVGSADLPFSFVVKGTAPQ